MYSCGYLIRPTWFMFWATIFMTNDTTTTALPLKDNSSPSRTAPRSLRPSRAIYRRGWRGRGYTTSYLGWRGTVSGWIKCRPARDISRAHHAGRIFSVVPPRRCPAELASEWAGMRTNYVTKRALKFLSDCEGSRRQICSLYFVNLSLSQAASQSVTKPRGEQGFKPKPH